MNAKRIKKMRWAFILVGVLVLALIFGSTAAANRLIPGIHGPTFDLKTGSASVITPDGDSLLLWCYDESTGVVQYPAPTLIVDQGDTVRVNLTNHLPDPVSIIFPGQGAVTTTPSGTNPGLLTEEAPNGATVQYQFEATHPGTYLYHSGTSPEFQIEMGLLGVIIVRPTGFVEGDPSTWRAYGHADTAFDHERLFLMTEMDPNIHDLVDFGFRDLVDNTTWNPVFWFINGRNGLDTAAPDNAVFHPNQPYSAVVLYHPGERLLMRYVDGGRDMHPLHPHGEHTTLIARDGRVLTSGDPNDPDAVPDLAKDDFTFNVLPGGTYDTIFDWTGYKLAWDIYGDPTLAEFDHDCEDLEQNRLKLGPLPSSEEMGDPDNICNDSNGNPILNEDCFDDVTWEYCPDHGKELPVALPGLQDLAFGGFYSGSPFLGHFGELPPGEGGLNIAGGLVFPWHSHSERELTDFDVYPGGMITFAFVVHCDVEVGDFTCPFGP